MDARAWIQDAVAGDEVYVDVSSEVVSILPSQDSAQVFGRAGSTYERLFKPAIDTLAAVILFVLTSPLIIAAALAIGLTMGRPVILKQDRVGKYGRIFTLYKFRTMEPDRRSRQVQFVGEDRRRTHKHPDDPRITPIGRFLRKWSLDELPQFLNVIKQDMSLVGPRPELLSIVAGYEPWQHRRHAVRPGITGLWQISQRGDKPLHECTESDLEYLNRLSLGTDLKILALTPLAALGVRRGH